MVDLLATVVLFLILAALFNGMSRDDTDNPEGKRSGLTLYTDHRTGCQYIQGSIFGGITPRLDANGKPMCAKKEGAR